MTNHSLCGILKADGRDCDIAVTAGSPFNVCPLHYRAIRDYLADAKVNAGETVRLSMPCPRCEVRALLASVQTMAATCGSCGYEVSTGEAIRLTAAMPKAPMTGPVRAPRTCVVYYIRFGDRIKIGTTNDLRTRMSVLPHDELLLTEPGSYELEKQRHRQFNRHLIAGREWFEAHPDLLEFIAQRKAALKAA